MKKYMKMVLSIVAIMGLSVAAFAADPLPGIVSYVTDDISPAFRVKYNGSASTATITVTTNTIVLVDGTGGTTTCNITNTAAYLIADMKAATNSSGKQNFSVEYVGAISSDSLTGNVLAASAASLTDGQWHEVALIDTSRQLQWNACSYGDNVPERWLTSIYGYPLGTGDATVTVYIDQGSGYTEVDKFFQTSPIYVSGSMASITNVSTADATVVINKQYSKDLMYGLRVPQKAKCLVRASRATTAGSGSIGATYTVK
jgi:hypothetical protein